jgi:hypothetical protein
MAKALGNRRIEAPVWIMFLKPEDIWFTVANPICNCFTDRLTGLRKKFRLSYREDRLAFIGPTSAGIPSFCESTGITGPDTVGNNERTLLWRRGAPKLKNWRN